MKKRTKVILFILEISDGGAETLVKDYAINIDRRKFDVRIVTANESDISSANYKILREHNIPIYCYLANPYNQKDKYLRMIQDRILVRLSPNFKDRYHKWYIQHIIKRLKPDVIHIHMAVMKYLPDISNDIQNCKLFYTCHSLPERYMNDTNCKEEKEAAKFLIANNYLQMVALHNDMRNELNGIFGINNTIVLNNCIDLERFTNVSVTKTEERQKLNIPTDAFVIGHVGRFFYVKNQSFLVDIFSEVIKIEPKAFLLMVGQGDVKEIKEKIKRLGLSDRYCILSNRSDIPEILRAMDVFVFPSILEGLGIAAIEAQAIGLRTIISNAVPKDVCFSENAIIADLQETPKEWAKKILNKDIKGMYTNDINMFDTKYVIKQIEKLYTSH